MLNFKPILDQHTHKAHQRINHQLSSTLNSVADDAVGCRNILTHFCWSKSIARR